MPINVEVRGYKDFGKYFENLNDNDPIKQKLNESITEMNNDINNGDYIKRKSYPKRYDKHGLTNLFVYNLPDARRLIYTIRGIKSAKIYEYLEVLTHKEYDIIFGYHTS